MQRTVVLTLAAIIAAGAARPVHAQQNRDTNLNDGAAYFAITTTPIGALPPVPAAGPAGAAGIAVRGQFGYLDEQGAFSRRVYGLGLDIPIARSTLGLTGGILDFACDEDDFDARFPGVQIDCKSGFIGGASWTTPLVSSSLGSDEVAELTLGIDGALGIGTGDLTEARFGDGSSSTDLEVSATSLAAGLGLPLALSAKSGGVTFVPHITPRFAFGRATFKAHSGDPDAEIENDEQSESGSRFMLGGGLGVLFARSGLGVTLGFQKVFVEDGKTLIGAGVSYTMR